MTGFPSLGYHRATSQKFNRVKRSMVRWAFERYFFYRLVKPYEGSLWRDGQWTKEIIRFYDEREWRYVPTIKDINGPSMIRKSKQDSEFDAGIAKLNGDIVKNGFWRLSFQPNDIKYIIVQHENEILDMLDKVIHIKRDKFSYKDVQLLTTRIISMDNIRENF